MTLIHIIIYILLAVIIFFALRTIVIAITAFSAVPFLPSHKLFIDKAIELLEIKEGDKVVDIGSGDARVLHKAAKQYPEAQFFGIEKNIFLVIWSRLMTEAHNLENVTIIHSDALKIDYSKYNKVYMYLTPKFLDKIMLQLKVELPKKTTVVCSEFKMGYVFSKAHKISKYPVKYGRKTTNIYKWIKE